MKDLLRNYYELTIIPALCLACLCGLAWTFFNWLDTSFAYVDPTQVGKAFLFFLGVMTLESLWKHIKRATNFLIEMVEPPAFPM